MKNIIPFLSVDDITYDIVIIKINKSYNPSMSALELYDITRGCWKRRLDSVGSAKYALATVYGEVVEVYEIDYWVPSILLNRQTIPYDPAIEVGRIGFFGSVAEQKVREKFIGKSVNNFFKKGEANPVKLIKAEKTGEIS